MLSYNIYAEVKKRINSKIIKIMKKLLCEQAVNKLPRILIPTAAKEIKTDTLFESLLLSEDRIFILSVTNFSTSLKYSDETVFHLSVYSTILSEDISSPNILLMIILRMLSVSGEEI